MAIATRNVQLVVNHFCDHIAKLYCVFILRHLNINWEVFFGVNTFYRCAYWRRYKRQNKDIRAIFFFVVNTVLIHINYDGYTAIFAFSGFVSRIQKRLNSIELSWIESKSKSASKRHITIKNTLLNWFIHNESRKVFWTPIIEGMKYETIITIITVCYTNFPCFLHVTYYVNKWKSRKGCRTRSRSAKVQKVRR